MSIYNRISEEIEAELEKHPILGKINTYDALSIVSHKIEDPLAQRIAQSTKEIIDPLKIPGLVDEKIKQAIANAK